MRAHDKFAGIHAQLFIGFDGEREIFPGRKVNRTNHYSGWLSDQQLGGNEALFVRSVRVDVQTGIHFKVKLHDAVLICGNGNLLRIEKLHELLRVTLPVVRLPGQFLRKREASRQNQNHPTDTPPHIHYDWPFCACSPLPRAFLMLASISSRSTSPIVAATTLPSRSTKKVVGSASMPP